MAQITEGTEVIYPRLRDFCSSDWHFVYNPPFQFNLEWLTTQDPAPHVNPCHSEWPLFLIHSGLLMYMCVQTFP